MSSFNENFRDFLESLEVCKVRYLVVGAHAMAMWGYKRATGDIDVFVFPSPENSERLIRALRQFGAPLGEIDVSYFARPGFHFQMGLEPSRIDILTSITGLDFEDAWASHEECIIQGVTTKVIGLDALIRNKTAADRPKDRGDVEELGKLLSAKGRKG